MTFTQGSCVRFLSLDFYSTYHKNASLVQSPDKSYHEIAQQMTQRVSQEIFQGLRRFPENLLCIDFFSHGVTDAHFLVIRLNEILVKTYKWKKCGPKLTSGKDGDITRHRE